MYKVKSPLHVVLGYSKRKEKDIKFILNLNEYRNAYYRVLNNAKKLYKQLISEQLLDKPRYERVVILYKIHKGDNRRHDIGNILAVHQKFFEDALVELGKLPDDKATLLPIVVYCNGSVDTENPRVDIIVYDLDNRSDVAQYKKDILSEIKRRV